MPTLLAVALLALVGCDPEYVSCDLERCPEGTGRVRLLEWEFGSACLCYGYSGDLIARIPSDKACCFWTVLDDAHRACRGRLLNGY